jgi:tRNA/tmRNA/rRNA uracil-C5-methylase (TrmA/RlmC/RlmD family)
MIVIKANFEHNGIAYSYEIRPVGSEPIPTYFHVYDEKQYFKGELLYYHFTGEWFFENNPDIADKLAEIVVLWYE